MIHTHNWCVKDFETLRGDPRGHVNLVTRICRSCPAEHKQYEIGYFSEGPFHVEPYEEVSV